MINALSSLKQVAEFDRKEMVILFVKDLIGFGMHFFIYQSDNIAFLLASQYSVMIVLQKAKEENRVFGQTQKFAEHDDGRQTTTEVHCLYQFFFYSVHFWSRKSLLLGLNRIIYEYMYN